MSKFKTRYINYTDKSFKKKFENLINDERKSNIKINLTVTKILKEILEKGDDGLNHFVGKFDKIKVKKIKDLFIPQDILKKSYDELKTKLNEVLGDTEVSAAVSTTTKEVPTAETSSTESNDFQEVFESKTEEVKKEDDEDLEDYFKSLAQD